MSFLPHAPARPEVLAGAMGISTAAHAAIASLLLSGAVVLLPDSQPADGRDAAFAISLEILDADLVEDADVIDDREIPEDAVATLPEDLETQELEQDFAALTPDETLLEPDTLPEDATEPDDTALAPVEGLAETVTAPEEVIEPDQTELAAPTVDPVNEPQAAEIEPDALVAEAPQIEPTPPVVEEMPLTIDDLSMIEDDVLSPLAEGGGGALLEPEIVSEPDTLATLAPDTTVLAPTTIEPSSTDEDVAALILPDPDTPPSEPEVLAPDVAEPEAAEEEDAQAGEAEADAASDQVEDAGQVAARPVPEATESDIAIGRLIRRVRAVSQPQCTLALPRRAGGAPGGGLSFIGADAPTLDGLAETITANLETAPVETREIVDPRQCAVLDALRQSDSYPANRIGLSLENATLLSGDSLRGSVIGAGGLFVTLLIVDDNGVVQDLAPFVSLDGNIPVFDAPVARSGPARATRQMLLAIGTTGAPLDLSENIGREAQDVFAGVDPDVLRSMVFGVVTFDVQ